MLLSFFFSAAITAEHGPSGTTFLNWEEMSILSDTQRYSWTKCWPCFTWTWTRTCSICTNCSHVSSRREDLKINWLRTSGPMPQGPGIGGEAWCLRCVRHQGQAGVAALFHRPYDSSPALCTYFYKRMSNQALKGFNPKLFVLAIH